MEALVELLSENSHMVQCPLSSWVCMAWSHTSFHWWGHPLLDAHHSQGHFMDKNQVPSLKETTVYLTSFTSLLSSAGRTWGIKKLLYKLCKISWNIQGLPVSDEEMVREQVHELWDTKFEEIIPLLLLIIVITAEAATLTEVTLYDVS